MSPLILLCIAVVILSLPPWPFGPNTVAFILAVIALVMVCMRWHV